MHSPQSVLLFVFGYPPIFLFPLAGRSLLTYFYYVASTTFACTSFALYIHVIYKYIYICILKISGMVYELLTRGVIKRRNKSECSVREERDMFIWDEEGRENDEYVLSLYLLQRLQQFSERLLFVSLRYLRFFVLFL